MSAASASFRGAAIAAPSDVPQADRVIVALLTALGRVVASAVQLLLAYGLIFSATLQSALY
jgi:hypothetical protein